MKHRMATKRLSDGRIQYNKYEKDDNFYFKKAGTITINAENLEKVDCVMIAIEHRKVVIGATKEEIKDWGDVKTFKNGHTDAFERKYHYPVEKWKVFRGDPDWWKELKCVT